MIFQCRLVAKAPNNVAIPPLQIALSLHVTANSFAFLLLNLYVSPIRPILIQFRGVRILAVPMPRSPLSGSHSRRSDQSLAEDLRQVNTRRCWKRIE